MSSIAAASPFPDFVNFSFPPSEYGVVLDHMLGFVTLAGGSQVDECACVIGGKRSVQFAPRDELRGRVGWLRFGGAALRAFEASRLFESVLAIIGGYEHKVTGMHVALDVRAESRPILNRIYRRGVRGEIRLTRKAIDSRHVSFVRRQALYAAHATGTVYAGNRRAGAWLKVYDKRNQILDVLETDDPDVLAFNDPGPLTRYEVALGRHVGLTLGDVLNPVPVFWHHMRRILQPPAGVADWEPGSVGYFLPPPEKAPPAVQLELLLGSSHDLRRAVKLADEIGPNGPAWLVSKLRRLVETSSKPHSATAPA